MKELSGTRPAQEDFRLDAAARDAARVVWRYMRLVHAPRPADFILCLGSFDVRVAGHAASLYLGGWAPRLAISGGLAHQGERMDPGWGRPEADVLAEAAAARGVPRAALVLERESDNTGENFAFTRALLHRLGLPARRCLAVSKPYMTRRAYATGRKVWPELELSMHCESAGLDDYLARDPDPERTLLAMVGDLHRIMVYPRLGFQVPQAVPPDVLAAFRTLVAAGYGRRLVDGFPP